MQILLYFAIMIVGIILSRKNLIPKNILDKIHHYQTLALCILLVSMGFAIGADESIIANLSIIGFNALIISIFTIIFSILIVKLIYRGGKL